MAAIVEIITAKTIILRKKNPPKQSLASFLYHPFGKQNNIDDTKTE